MAFLTSLKFTLVIYALLAAFGGFKWMQSSHYKNKAATQEKVIAVQKAAIESWEKTVESLQKEKEVLSNLITEEKKKTKDIETKHTETVAELATLKENYSDVKKYLDTNIPDRLSIWLCKRYGSKGRENIKAKTASGVLQKAGTACTERYTTDNVMSFVQKLDETIDRYELKMDLLSTYYEQTD